MQIKRVEREKVIKCFESNLWTWLFGDEQTLMTLKTGKGSSSAESRFLTTSRLYSSERNAALNDWFIFSFVLQLSTSLHKKQQFYFKSSIVIYSKKKQ